MEEALGGVLGFVLIAGFVAVVLLFGKAKDAASKALAQKVINKKQFERGKHILEGFTFETGTSPSAVMQQLEKRVVAAEAPSGLTARLYVALRKPNRIDYVYGNKFAESFRVAVVLESRGEGALGVLKPVTWHETEGIIVAQEWLTKLVEQVQAAVRELDPKVGFVEGVHDSVKLTVPAEKAATGPAPDAPPPSVAPQAAASAAPAATPAVPASRITPIAAPTKSNANMRWAGFALVAGAMLWLTVGVQVSLLPVWFAVIAAGGTLIYLADRAARKAGAPATDTQAAEVPVAPPAETALPAGSPQPTLSESLATDESEPDPYAWAAPKVDAPGSAPVTLNSVLGGFKNIVIGVALLGIGGWSLLTGEVDIIPALLMLGVGIYFLVSKSFEGKVVVFAHRIADTVAGWLLAGAIAGSSRLSSAGVAVKPVILARVGFVLGFVATIVGAKALQDGSRPVVLFGLFVGMTLLWLWGLLEKRVAQGQTAAPAAAVIPNRTAAAGLSPSNRRMLLIGGAVVAVLVVGVVISSVVSNSAGSGEEDYETTADRPLDEVDPYTLSPDSHARTEADLLPSAPADGSAELLDVVFMGGSSDDFDLSVELTIVGRTPAEWYTLLIPLDLGYYVDGDVVTEPEFLQAINGAERAEGMIVFDQAKVYEVHVFTQGQTANDDPRLAGGKIRVPDHQDFDITAEQWDTLEWADAMTAYIGAIEKGFADAGLVGDVELVYYTGTEQRAQDPAAGSSVPAGTTVHVTMPVSD